MLHNRRLIKLVYHYHFVEETFFFVINLDFWYSWNEIWFSQTHRSSFGDFEINSKIWNFLFMAFSITFLWQFTLVDRLHVLWRNEWSIEKVQSSGKIHRKRATCYQIQTNCKKSLKKITIFFRVALDLVKETA